MVSIKKSDIENINLLATLFYLIFGFIIIFVSFFVMIYNLTQGLIVYAIGLMVLLQGQHIKLLKKNTDISLADAIKIKLGRD
jgi:hypothetical protein